MKLKHIIAVFFVAVQMLQMSYAQQSVNLQDGLVGYWAINEGSGNSAKDSTSTNADGTLVAASWAEGYYGQAVNFISASNGYIDMGKKLYSKLNNASQITLSCWIKNTDHPDLRYDIFNTFNASGSGFCVYLAPKGELRIGGRSTATEVFKSNGFNYTFSGTWVHVLATVDYANKEFILYLNATKIPVKVGALPNFSSNKYQVSSQNVNDFIGGFKGRNYTFNGGIDDVRLYNRKLNEDEIYALARPDLNPNLVSAQDKEREKVNGLSALMQNNVALYADKNHAIVGNKRYFIDGNNAAIMPFIECGYLYIPVSFVAKKFNANVNWDKENGLMTIIDGTRTVEIKNGTDFIKVNNQKVQIKGAVLVKNETLFVPSETVATALNKQIYQGLLGKLAVYGNNINAFKDEASKEIVAVMPGYFLPEKYSAPKRDVRDTRQELLYLDPAQKKYVANPSIEKLPDGTFIASCTNSGTGLVTYIFRSTDGAKSWSLVTTLSDIMWATLFHHNGALYLIGTKNSLGDIVIRKSMDKGTTWTTATNSQTGVLFKGGTNPYDNPPNHHTAPTPVLKANGRIYRAFEDNDPHEFPKMKAFLISAPENSDLLDASNWTATDKTSYDYQNWKEPYNFLAPGWLEGNAVQAPDGKVWNFIRFNSRPYADKAAVLRLSSDGQQLLFNYPQDIIDFPGGTTKFSIKYDTKTHKYYSLVNNSVDTTFAGHRCVLSLVVSDDLINWKIVETVLYDDNLHIWEDSMLLVGYQYVDFVFDGDNIVFAVRESWGGAANYHDANRFTTYILKDYAKYVE
ncbi:stalk domain-containing protein [Pseudopedobacter beijingensis]|uniref:Stalk domain-containing protein n=1 Tax=Pseudopedobacter beijingensis TaxID=1207056 RepID=A0ABW4I7E8_9SPHI